ncbi:MAG: hypothetical protein ACE5E6_00245 [Phycisphaerae bacterium]
MIRYACDGCGTSLSANDAQRYIVKLEIYAAAGPVSVTDDADVGAILKALATADPNDIEDQTYRRLCFDLCDTCRRVLLKHPLGALR